MVRGADTGPDMLDNLNAWLTVVIVRVEPAMRGGGHKGREGVTPGGSGHGGRGPPAHLLHLQGTLPPSQV